MTNRESLTPNQVVAYNLRRAREMRGWTAEVAATELEPFLGTHWSKQVFSQAEGSTRTPDRVRQFTADDLVAFARCFAVPVTYFLMPPDVDAFREPPVLRVPDGEISMPELLELVAGTAEIADRMARTFGDDGLNGYPIEHFTESQQQIGTLVGLYAAAAVRSHTRDLSVWRSNLADLDALLADIEVGIDQSVVQAVTTKKQRKARA